MKNLFWVLLLSFLTSEVSMGQSVDTTFHKTTITTQTTVVVTEEHSDENPRTPFFQKKLVRTMIVPSVLIGWGLSVMHDNGLYSSIRCSTDIARLGISPGFSSIDDYLIWAPYAGLVALELNSVGNKSDFINTSLKIAKSSLLTLAVFEILKHTTKVERPDRNPDDWQQFLSFPSGHTAMAFATATLFHQEYRHKSPIYSIAAYTVASSVGIMRMLHNRHWQADVFVGAGIGILCTNIVYLTHKYRWGRDNTSKAMIVPMYNKGTIGLSCTKSF